METEGIEQPSQQSPDPPQQWATTARTPAASMATEGTQCQLSQLATVLTTPGENTPRSYVLSTPDGAKYQQNSLML